MPNWCYNYLRINGSESSIKQITDILTAEVAKGNDGRVFEPLVGIKPDITREEYDNGGWWQANIDYWGCKWDLNASEWSFDSDSQEIIMSFDSAWSPAAGFADLLTKKYGVETRLEFHETGNYFAGYQLTAPDMEPDYRSWEYMEGLYHIDTDEFWFRFGQNVWDSYDDADEDNPARTIEEILEDEEYAFFTELDKAMARREYEAQKADVLKYLAEQGTLEERLEKHRESLKKES